MSERELKDRSRVELNFILSIVMVIVVGAGLYVKQIIDSASEQNQVHIKEVTVQIANNISGKLNNYIDELEYINNNIIANNGFSLDDKFEIIKYKVNESSFEDILTIDNTGNGKRSKGEHIYIGETPYFEAISNSNGIFVSEPMKSQILGQSVVLYSFPVIIDKERVGYVIGVNKTESLISLLSTSIYEDKGESYIINQDGDILISKNKDEIGMDVVKIMDIDSNKINSYGDKYKDIESGAIKEIIQGKNSYLGFSKIPHTDNWYVINSVPEDSVFQNSQNTMRLIIILISGIVIVFIIIVGYFIKNHRNLKKVAFEDKLTNISNYEKFILDINEYISKRKNKKCVLICFDVDKFKIINDIYGYKTGDEVLKTISKNLKKYFGTMAVYGRLRGDIFGLVIEFADREQELENLVTVIKDEITSIDENNTINSQFNIEVCIGVYIIGNKNISINKIIDNADTARLKSKENLYKDAVIFDEKMSEEKNQMIQMEKDLFSSIENNELIVYYQPKFNIFTDKIVGSEALIRWKHPTMGMISPMKFIPIAEKNKFINKIGNWIFEEVCSSLRKCIDEGIEVVPIAVNISRVELYQSDLLDNFVDCIKKYNIDPELIEIEITETTALNNTSFINAKLNEIKALGIKVAMDDFGTGNSNLSNLKNIPIDILKLDRSLLVDIEKNNKTEVMVNSIVNLSKNLCMSTICEGVENINQVEIIKNTGCEIVQGYVFSKPIEEKAYKAILRANKSKIV